MHRVATFSPGAEVMGSTVDMVLSGVDAVDGANPVDPAAAAMVANWVQQSKAPVLCVDPPREGVYRAGPTPQWALLPLLPLALDPELTSMAGLYPCDLGIPRRVFKDLGVEYASPFGSKFVVALHSKKTH